MKKRGHTALQQNHVFFLSRSIYHILLHFLSLWQTCVLVTEQDDILNPCLAWQNLSNSKASTDGASYDPELWWQQTALPSQPCVLVKTGRLGGAMKRMDLSFYTHTMRTRFLEMTQCPKRERAHSKQGCVICTIKN